MITRTKLAAMAFLSFLLLEVALIAGLYQPEMRIWIDAWLLYPASFAVVLFTAVVVPQQLRRYLVQPVLALIVIILAAAKQETDPAQLDVSVMVIHAIAIIWLALNFARFVAHVPPDYKSRRLLAGISAGLLALIEVLYLGYLVHQPVTWLNAHGGLILTMLVAATAGFAFTFAIVLRVLVKNSPPLKSTPPEPIKQGS